MRLTLENKCTKSLRLTRTLLGQSQFLTSPVPAQPISFNLSLDDTDQDERPVSAHPDSESRLLEMLAAQAAHRDDASINRDEDSIAMDKKIPEHEKRSILQRALQIAASNGDVERLGRIVLGPAREFVDLNAADEEGTAPLIYASCFVSR